MALFGFGKKKKKKDVVQEERSFVKLNNRTYPRYLVQQLHTSFGEAIDISNNSIQVSSEKLSLGDSVELEVEGQSYEAEVSRVLGKRAALKIKGHFPKELIDKFGKDLDTNVLHPKRSISLEEIASQKDITITKALINLMLEIEDPNTNIAKFKENIEVLEDLKKKILDMANSVEIAGRGRVDDVGSAITRLGFDVIKKVVYNYINYEVSLAHNELEHFHDFDLYNIFLSAIFKKLAPQFNFKDIKNEGQSLLAMSAVGAFTFSQESSLLSNAYKSPKELFSYEARLSEYRECGFDMLEVDKIYFLEILGVFRYLYDGFVLANYMIYPYYAPRHLKIELSQRKLRFAYVTYMSLLAQRYLFGRDKTSGFIFFQRLKRFGISEGESEKWFATQIRQINKKLKEIGFEKEIGKPVSPAIGIAIESYLGTGIYVNYFLSKIEQFGHEADRISIRFEDSGWTHVIIEKIINSERYSFLQMPFCIVPCEILEDDEISLATFEGFELLIFQNLDKLPAILHKDFIRLWREFEGKIMVTFGKKSMLEYESRELFEIINEQMVDFPSYHQTQVLQLKMIQYECKALDGFFQQSLCNIDEFKNKMIDFYGVGATILQKI